jgi:hypothetical protein
MVGMYHLEEGLSSMGKQLHRRLCRIGRWYQQYSLAFGMVGKFGIDHY